MYTLSCLKCLDHYSQGSLHTTGVRKPQAQQSTENAKYRSGEVKVKLLLMASCLLKFNYFVPFSSPLITSPAQVSLLSDAETLSYLSQNRKLGGLL